MPTKLPPELISLIISNFDGNGDRRVLKNICLSSSLLLKSAQSILFRHIHLGPGQWGRDAADTIDYGEKLLELLRKSPRILSYIREVTISDFGQAYSSFEWLTKGLKLAEALNMLQVERLTSFSFQRHYKAKWLLLCSEVREAVVRLCKAPSLERLSIRTAPLALLGLCVPSLKHFEAGNAEVGEDHQIPPITRSSCIALESLRLFHVFDLDGYVQYLLNPTSHINLSSIQTLDITAVIPSDHGHTSTLLKACQHSIKAFRFEPQTDNPPDIEPNLSKCSVLSHLEISLDVTAIDGLGRRDAIRWLAGYLDKEIPNTNAIEILRLNLDFDLFDVPGGLTGETGNTIYLYTSQIGILLSSARRFPKLRDVQIAITSDNVWDADVEEIREFIWGALGTALRERGILTVTASPQIASNQAQHA